MSRPNDQYTIVKWIHGRIPSKRDFFKAGGYIPHKGQEQIHAALDIVDTVVVAAGVRCGKTMAAAWEMFYESMLPRKEFIGWTVAPTTNLADIVFDQVLQYLREHFRKQPNLLQERITDGELEFPNFGGGRSRIYRKSTFDAAGKGKLTGQAVDFMVIDEAAKIQHDSIWDNELSTRLVDRGGKVLLISSPMGQGGFFARLYHEGLMVGSDSIGIRMPSWMNPHIPPEKFSKIRAITPARAWRQEWCAEFIAQDGNVFGESDLMRCSRGEFEDPEQGVDYFAGVDLAMSEDYTVVLLFRRDQYDCPVLVRMMRMQRVPPSEQMRRVCSLLKQYNNAPAYVDATGLGKPFIQSFQQMGAQVIPITWNAPKKTEMTRNAMLLIENGYMTLPRQDQAPEIIRELSVYRWKQVGGYEVGEAPPGYHDDIVSAMLMGCMWFKAMGIIEARQQAALLKEVVQEQVDQVLNELGYETEKRRNSDGDVQSYTSGRPLGGTRRRNPFGFSGN